MGLLEIASLDNWLHIYFVILSCILAMRQNSAWYYFNNCFFVFAIPCYVSWFLLWALKSFFYLLFCSLGTSLTMDQFAWTKAEALYYMGILMSVGAVVACVTFVVIGPLCKR
jgi:hypothetical protein